MKTDRGSYGSSITLEDQDAMRQMQIRRPGQIGGGAPWVYRAGENPPKGVLVSQRAQVLVAGARSTLGYNKYAIHCYDLPDTKVNVWTVIRPKSLEALSAVTATPVEEFPWQIRTWSPVRPYTGNHILDRLDPAETHLENPWDSLSFKIGVGFSARALHARRKAAGLPRVEFRQEQEKD